MKPKHVKKLLISEIESTAKSMCSYVISKETDFTRNRKLPFLTIIKSIIGMESKSLTNELIDIFPNVESLPSASAFVQQRQKIKAEAFKAIFNGFTNKLMSEDSNDMVTLAVDGSDIQIPINYDDKSSYHPGANGQKPYNLLHLNALYDLNKHIYADALIQGKRNLNEHFALQQMVDKSNIDCALIIADRGYESYNSMAHIQEKGWFFLIRIRDGICGIKAGFELPEEPEYDVSIELNLTRKQTIETKKLFKDRNHYRALPATTPFDYLPSKSRKSDPTRFYKLNFRLVRFEISDGIYESVVTNLDSLKYPPSKLKELYAERWGIESSFRDLKYTIGMLNFHSKKVMCIHQEIYAHLIMYNFAEMITSHVVIEKKQRKYTYKANFSVAAHVCRQFFQGKTTSPNLETIIARNTIPIRTGRHRERNLTAKVFRGFLYRVA